MRGKAAGFWLVGRSPWSARVPLDPPPLERQEQAGEGAGRRPGGPPHHGR